MPKRERFEGAPVAVAIELAQGPIVVAPMERRIEAIHVEQPLHAGEAIIQSARLLVEAPCLSCAL